MSRALRTITIALACLAACAVARGDTTAIIAEKVYTMTGKPLSNAVVLIRDGRIIAVGPKVKIPSNARLLRAKVVLPGLIAAYTHLAGSALADNPLSVGKMALASFNRHTRHRAAISEGVTTAYVAATGRLVGGQGAVVHLAGPATERVINKAATVEVALGRVGLNPPGEFKAAAPPSSANPFRAAKPSYPSTRMGELALLQEDPVAAARWLAAATQTNTRSVAAVYLHGYVAWSEGKSAEAQARLLAARHLAGGGPEEVSASAEGQTRRGHRPLLESGRISSLAVFWRRLADSIGPDAQLTADTEYADFDGALRHVRAKLAAAP